MRKFFFPLRELASLNEKKAFYINNMRALISVLEFFSVIKDLKNETFASVEEWVKSKNSLFEIKWKG